MKIKEGFVLREVAGSYVVVAVGKASFNFKGVVKLNESGALLFRTIDAGVDSEEELVNKIMSEYKIDYEVAKKDVSTFVSKLKGAGIIE
ncbi:MAG: PqqD family protein [Bacilli bacterium]|nr:PqqD family protein [Bacilli bacterium]